MEQHSAELNALTKDEIDKFKRTSMHNKVTMNWLKSHHVDKAKLQYLFFPEELYKHCEINDLFRGFDQDQSEGIEVSELINMFKDNNIKLNRAEIDAIFHLVDANGDNTLNLSEFKKSVFSDHINQAFAKLMRNFRARQGIKKIGPQSLRSLPKVENLQGEGVALEQQGDGLKSNLGSLKDLGSKNELGVVNDQGKFASKRTLQSFDNVDEKDEKYRVIPSTFASMVEYFSYNFQRKEQIKKCSMIPSTQALPKAVQLENLMQLSSKYTDQTLAKIYKLHDRYRYRSFDSFTEEHGIDNKDSEQLSNIPSFHAETTQLQEGAEVEDESKSQLNNTNPTAILKQSKALIEHKYSTPVIDNPKYETAKSQTKNQKFYFPNKHSVQAFSSHGQNRTISTANVSYQSPSTSFSRVSSKRQISKRSFPVISSDHPQYLTPNISQCSTPLISQATSILPSTAIASPPQLEQPIQTKKAQKLAKLLQSEIPPSQNFSLKRPPYLQQFKTGRHSLHNNPPDEQTQGDTNMQRQSHFIKTFFKNPLKQHKKNQLSADTTFLSLSKTATTSPTTTKIHRFSQGNTNTAQISLFETPQTSLLSSAAGSVRKRSLRIEEQYLKSNIRKIDFSQPKQQESEEIQAPSTLLELVRRQHGENLPGNEAEFTDKRQIQKQQLQLQKQQQMCQLQQGNQTEDRNSQEIIPMKSKTQLDETGEEFQKFSFSKRANSQPTLVQYPPKVKSQIPKYSKIILNISNLTTDSCFQDTMFTGKQSEIQNNYQEELLLQGDQKEEKQQPASRGNRDLSNYSRDTSSTRPGIKSQNNFPSQNSFKRIDSLTRMSNFLSVTPLTTTEHLISTLTTFNHNNKNNLPQTSKGKRLTFQ